MELSVQRFPLVLYVPADRERFGRYVKAARELGCIGVGTGLGLAEMEDAGRIEGMKQTLEQQGMELHALHSPIGLATADGDPAAHAARVRRVLNCAASLGARSTIWHFRHVEVHRDAHLPIGERIHGIPPARLDDLMRTALHDACAYATSLEVEINLENLPLFAWSRDSSEILEFIRACSLPNLGFILDTGHAWCNGEHPGDVIRQAGSWLRDTHIHDNLGSRGFDFHRSARQADITPARDLHLVPGMGTIDWIDVVRALREIGYNGAVAFEGIGMRGHPDDTEFHQWMRCARWSVELWQAFEELAQFLPDPEA